MSSPAEASPELELVYSPRRLVADAEVRLAEETALSRTVRERLSMIADLPYGEADCMRCDLFGPGPADPSAPVHVFLHGGFWRSRDKTDYSYIADPLAGAGVTTLVANYGLCPAFSISAIVDQIVRLFHWLRAGAGDLGLQPERLTASGHSAGAHLIAAAAARSPELLEGQQRLAHATLISGLYDLRPLLGLSLNAVWGLDPEAAARNSPTLTPAPAPQTAMTVVVGGGEPNVWHRQSDGYARHLQAAGHTVEWLEGGDHDHFSILRSILELSSPLRQHLLNQACGPKR